MPMLQVDGENVAVLSEDDAHELLRMRAMNDLGRSRRKATLQREVRAEMSRPEAPAQPFTLELEFPVSES